MRLVEVPKKYTKNGAINPFYIVALQKRKEQERKILDIADKLFAEMDLEKYNQDKLNDDREKQLQADLEFLQKHSGNKLEYELAKKIVGIK